MTPRTKRLYAFVDSTSSNILGSLEDTRKISFRRDEPKPKKAKHLAEILHPEKDPLAFM